jgi:hypothetical protein
LEAETAGAGRKGDYDQYIKKLAMRLYEANMEAQKRSKLSHELAKRYYDQKACEIQLKQGDFVYLYNPIAKRGKAKKFEYKYQGPYMILKRISPLIYKLQIEERKFIIVHVNRLKGAYGNHRAGRDALGTEEPKRDRVKELPKQHTPRRCMEIEDPLDEGLNTPPTRIDEVEESEVIDTDEESVDTSPTLVNQEHPEWTPETRYLRCNISHEVSKSAGGTHGVPYALRSRTTLTQSQGEMNELDQPSLPASGGPGQSSSNTEGVGMHSHTPHTHSYNLRSRTRTQTS